MRKYDNNEDDAKELKILRAEDWQLELVKKNPNYVWWGCVGKQ